MTLEKFGIPPEHIEAYCAECNDHHSFLWLLRFDGEGSKLKAPGRLQEPLLLLCDDCIRRLNGITGWRKRRQVMDEPYK